MEAAQAVRLSEARKRAVVASSLDAVITMDHEGRVVEFNPAAERIFGYRRGARSAGDRRAGDPALAARASPRGLARYVATGEAGSWASASS